MRGGRDDAREAGGRERAAALGRENERRLGGLLAPQAAQGPQLVAQDGVRGRGALLGAANVQVGGREVHLVPAQIGQLRGAEAVTVGDQQHRGVAVAPAAFLGRGDQALDFIRGQVLARAQLGVRAAPVHVDCLFNGGWRDQAQVRICSHLQPLPGDDCLYNNPSTNKDKAKS